MTVCPWGYQAPENSCSMNTYLLQAKYDSRHQEYNQERDRWGPSLHRDSNLKDKNNNQQKLGDQPDSEHGKYYGEIIKWRLVDGDGHKHGQRKTFTLRNVLWNEANRTIWKKKGGGVF